MPIPSELVDEVTRLCDTFGGAALREAVKRQVKAKRGRPTIRDGDVFSDEYYRDARDWLDGRDPIAMRPHHLIAAEYAKNKLGYNEASTRRRVSKNLALKRPWLMIFMAVRIAKAEHPYAAYLRALDARLAASPDEVREVWLFQLATAKQLVADMPNDFGGDTTFAEIEWRSKQPPPLTLGALSRLGR